MAEINPIVIQVPSLEEFGREITSSEPLEPQQKFKFLDEEDDSTN